MYNLNHTKYEQSTISKFDIIGSYFVNLYYNEFYNKAKNIKTNGNAKNITEAYKNVLCSYIDFSKKPDFFKQIVKGIHMYCISTTRYTTMTHKECIDFMVNEFIPDKLWNSLREHQKNKLFHETIINCISIFTEKIISKYLTVIIDNHDLTDNITILQNLFLDIILFEKDKIYSKFINPSKGKSINLDLFREKINTLVNEKNDLIKQNTKISELVKKYANMIIILQNKNKDLQSNYDILQKSLELNKKSLSENKLTHERKQNKPIVEHIHTRSKTSNIDSHNIQTELNKYNDDTIEQDNIIDQNYNSESNDNIETYKEHNLTDAESDCDDFLNLSKYNRAVEFDNAIDDFDQ